MPSRNPPAGLNPRQVPQFIVLGSDDNLFGDGVEWVLQTFKDKRNPAGSGNARTFDGGPAHISFYLLPSWVNDSGKTVGPEVVAAWKQAYLAGHEIGNHTWVHDHGGAYTIARWKSEMARCDSFIVSRVGVPKDRILGFRAPFLEYNHATFEALKQEGLIYDCSAQRGWQEPPVIDGGNNFWPFTMDDVKPEGDTAVGGTGNHPGVWELPVDAVYVPSERGFKDTKTTGFDWNLWVPDGGLSGERFAKTLKHSLDLKYAGNRAPMNFGFHSHFFSAAWDSLSPDAKSIKARLEDRRAAFREFVDYALTLPDVRFVSAQELLQWMRKPIPLGTHPK